MVSVLNLYVAGSHDIPLLNRTLSQLSTHASGTISIPRYNKSLRGGRGDRCPESEWTTIQGMRPLNSCHCYVIQELIRSC